MPISVLMRTLLGIDFVTSILEVCFNQDTLGYQKDSRFGERKFSKHEILYYIHFTKESQLQKLLKF